MTLRRKKTIIICSAKTENLRKLDNLHGETGMKFSIGDIPKEERPHKMFTFCTSTVYVGADFYSTNAYSYILPIRKSVVWQWMFRWISSK